MTRVLPADSLRVRREVLQPEDVGLPCGRTTLLRDPAAVIDRRGVDLFLNSDAEQLSRLVALIDSGELRVDVAQRVPLAELSAVHAQAAAGELHGKVVIVAPAT
ncbi:zinc-binding dehydrogenase [Streptomyces sp. NPDC050759]|uniref:zinc-binding dehydrogenase n=1 Tax=Streptomyces sp. NPDC050759 TaxID=3365635 RepID=UPI0037BA9FB6